MRRRYFLAALGATVGAGCGARPDSQSSETTPPTTRANRALDATATDARTTDGTRTTADDARTTDSDSPTTEDDARTTGSGDPSKRGRHVVDQQTTGRTLALSPAGHTTADHGRVELRFGAPATADGPAVLRATLTNLNDFANTFRLHDTPAFGIRSHAMPDTTTNRLPVFLAPTGNHDLRTTAPEFERTDDGRWVLERKEKWLPRTVTLAPDETVHGEYYVLGHPDSRKPPLGRYEIGADFALGLTAWRSSRSGPDGHSTFAGETVLSLPVEAPVHWYHEADSATQVYLQPSTERTTLPAKVDFVLHNHSRATLGCESFAIYRQEADGWRRLTWGYAVQACYSTPPGDRKTFRLRAFPGKVIPGGDHGMRGRSMQLDPGRYAFVVRYDEAYAALFEFTGTACRSTTTGQ